MLGRQEPATRAGNAVGSRIVNDPQVEKLIECGTEAAIKIRDAAEQVDNAAHEASRILAPFTDLVEAIVARIEAVKQGGSLLGPLAAPFGKLFVAGLCQMVCEKLGLDEPHPTTFAGLIARIDAEADAALQAMAAAEAE